MKLAETRVFPSVRVAVVAGLGLLVASCGKQSPPESDTIGDTETGGIDPTGVGDASTGPKLDIGGGNDTTPGGGCDVDMGCSNRLDLLFIIDNSGSMAEEQLNLAKNMPLLVERLEQLEDAMGNPLSPDVHIMVTTTDMGNDLCTPFYRPGRSPEQGAPIDTACTDRLDRFTGLGVDPVEAAESCTQVCPDGIAPNDHFIKFGPGGTNVPDAPEADVNGDGKPDSAVAQALACLGPQGIDGCGYESPLEAMRSALDPDAPWNQGDDPFLRQGGLLAIAIITDEADCSIADASVMTDAQYQEEHPDTGMKVPTSAICWNAGVSCDGPDGNGVYSNCQSTGSALVPVQEYIDLLRAQGRPVVMLGILGVPIVTERNPDPPFEPVAGGVAELEYRQWRDPEYPDGDILPDQWSEGIDAAYKQYEYGIGPGCTGEAEGGGFTGQAIPPVRVKEVCQALDTADEIRCCIESICDTDFSHAIRCMTGLIQENTTPQG